MSKSGKGSAFEREICRQLSKWWTKGENENVFWRTSQSGGRMTSLAKKGKASHFHHGDVCAIDPIGQPLLDFVSIELKRGYATCTVADILDRPENGPESQFQKWLNQAQTSAAHSGSYGWLLITKRDRRDALVFMPKEVWDALQCGRLNAADGIFDDFVCMKLNWFLTSDPDEIKTFISEMKGGE